MFRKKTEHLRESGCEVNGRVAWNNPNIFVLTELKQETRCVKKSYDLTKSKCACFCVRDGGVRGKNGAGNSGIDGVSNLIGKTSSLAQ